MHRLVPLVAAGAIVLGAVTGVGYAGLHTVATQADDAPISVATPTSSAAPPAPRSGFTSEPIARLDDRVDLGTRSSVTDRKVQSSHVTGVQLPPPPRPTRSVRPTPTAKPKSSPSSKPKPTPSRTPSPSPKPGGKPTTPKPSPTPTPTPAKRHVTLIAVGKTYQLTTTATTVRALLSQHGIVVDADDRVSPGLGTALVEGAVVRYDRVSVETVTRTEVIKHQTVRRDAPKLPKGVTRVLREGVDGKRQLTSEVTRVNGTVTKHKPTGNKVLVAPISKIVLVGSKSPANG